MIKINKVDERTISVENGNVVDTLSASYEALSQKKSNDSLEVVTIRTKSTLTPIAMDYYHNIMVDGKVYASAVETVKALNAFIGNFSKGGSTPISTESWKSNPAWWDIEKILEEDIEPAPYGKFIILLTNTPLTTNLTFDRFSKIKTSDGVEYTTNTVHTWDLSKDKGDGDYKTRYLIFILNGNYALQELKFLLNSLIIVKIVFDNCNFVKLMEGLSNLQLLNSVIFNDNCRVQDTNAGNLTGYCPNLEKLKLSKGFSAITWLHNLVTSCPSITYLDIPETFTNLNNIQSICRGNLNIRTVNIHAPFNIIDPGTAAYVFVNCRSLTTINIHEKSILNQSINLEYTMLSQESLSKFIKVLLNKTITTSTTLTINSRLSQMISDDEKLLLIQKNWSIAITNPV